MSGLSNYQKYIMETAFKNVVKGKSNTNSNLSWYEEYEDISKRINISSIWIDSDYIPFNAPFLRNGEFYTHITGDVKLNILEKLEDVILEAVPNTKASYFSESLVDAIDPAFGNGYSLRLVDNDNRTIPFGLNKWVIEPESGTITFIEGFPTDYTLPIHASFYRYVGRKGSDGILTNDGSSTMVATYKPSEDQSIATKAYVDSNVSEVDRIVTKLVPDLPDTFEGKDLEILNTYYMANVAFNTDPAVPVVLRRDKTLSLRVPTFYNFNNKGTVSILVDNVEVYKQDIADMVEGQGTIFHIDSIVDPYEDNIVSDDFYKSINMTVNLDIDLELMKYYNSSEYPVVSFTMKYTSVEGNVILSNPLAIGMDYRTVGEIKNMYFSKFNNKNTQKYISGVPAMVYGDVFNFNFSINPINKFKTDVMGHATIEANQELYNEDIYTAPYYKYDINGISIDKVIEIAVPENCYSESITTHLTSTNIIGESITNDTTYAVRIDSVSSEAGRVTSPSNPDDESSIWVDYGNNWESYKNLRFIPELQMLNGKYQWPRGNYVNNGKFDSSGLWEAGPNYNDLTEHPIRLVTLEYDLPLSNGFFFDIEGKEGFVQDDWDYTIQNVEFLKCKVENETGWLDMNFPYDGVLNPNDTENKACLVVNKSSKDRGYVTFGNTPISGKLYITLGIRKDMNFKFSRISVIPNI